MSLRSHPSKSVRATSLFVAALALTAALGACGSDDDSPAATATESAAEPTNAPTTVPVSVSATAPATESSSESTPVTVPSTTEPVAEDLDLSGVTLVFGFQTADYPELLKASGLFDDIEYKLETPVIAGPAAQIAALTSNAIDIGLVGENTAAFEAANEDEDLSTREPNIYTIAGVSYPDSPYPAPSIYVYKSANIKTLADLKGHSIAYNFGGNIYAGYVRFLAEAGLTVDDVTPVELPSNQEAAAAFVAGQTDAVVTGYSQVARLVESGEVELLATNEDVGIKGGAGFITRPDVLADELKLAAARDFFSRFSRYYSEWYPAHEAEVIAILEDVLKQTPEIAKLNFDTQKSGKLYKVGDPDFIAQIQAIVDAAFAAGGVKHDYDIAKVFNPIFDDVAVPE